MKHILIPIDFSAQSWKTVRCAIDLHARAGTRFYLFYSEEHTYGNEEVMTLQEAPVKQLQAWLQKAQALLAPGQVIVSCKWEGSFIADIRAAVNDNAIDLIVMSTHYPNIFDEELKNSHVREVITRLKCPVFIVPRDFNCHPPQQLVLLSDFNFRHQEEAIDAIKQFAIQTGAHLNIVQLSKTGKILTEAQRTNKLYLQATLDALPHSFHFVLDKSLEEALQFFVKVHQVDVVMLFAKNVHLSERILLSPTFSEAEDYHKYIPFFVVHEQ